MSTLSNQQAYFEQVWTFVRQVPYGKVVTYGQIARSIGEPPASQLHDSAFSAARLVGSAMAACPTDVPWHRVINAQGKVSSRGDAARQVRLLEAEGLSLALGRINLSAHQWQGPDQPARPTQQSLF